MRFDLRFFFLCVALVLGYCTNFLTDDVVLKTLLGLFLGSLSQIVPLYWEVSIRSKK